MSNKKILMVCLGNICRSPVAEGILKKKILENNLLVEVDSAGTSNYHIGDKADQRSIANSIKNKVDISAHIAKQFTENDFERVDVIYAMDKNNFENIIKLAKTPNDRKKVFLILDELENKNTGEVPDPYFGGENGFQIVFNLLDEACNKIIKKLKLLRTNNL